MNRTWFVVGLAASALCVSSHPASAQLTGTNALGDFGLQSGTQPPPAFYVGGFYTHYSTQSVRDRHGNEITLPVDSGARTTTSGRRFWAIVSLPIPSVPID